MQYGGWTACPLVFSYQFAKYTVFLKARPEGLGVPTEAEDVFTTTGEGVPVLPGEVFEELVVLELVVLKELLALRELEVFKVVEALGGVVGVWSKPMPLLVLRVVGPVAQGGLPSQVEGAPRVVVNTRV